MAGHRHTVTAPTKLEVPVQRLAEFVPASFTAAGKGDNDPLNLDGSRWYKTGDDKLTLVLGDGANQFALEFDAIALCALAERAKSMSETDIGELLGL